jgi:HSP20 family protein
MRRNPGDDDESGPFGGRFGGIEELLAGMTDGGAEAVDVHEYDDEIRVVADVPGTSRDRIDVRCDGRAVAIRADRDGPPFVARVDLPAYVDDGSGELQFNNGVLEVTFDRDTDPANIGFH